MKQILYFAVMASDRDHNCDGDRGYDCGCGYGYG